MAERQKRQQQIAPADAAAANGSERRSPLPGDRGDRGSKVTNSPQPACPPPARQINGRAQPARPAPFPERQRRARPGQGSVDEAGVRAFVRGPPPGRARPALSSSPFCLARCCWFSPPTGKLTSPRPGRVGGGDEDGFALCGLPSRPSPEFAPPPGTRLPLGAGSGGGEGL